MNVYEDHRLENKNLPFIFNETKALPIHSTISSCNWHENVEFFQITDGCGTVSCNGQLLRVKKGDVVCFSTNRLHSYETDSMGMSFRYIIVDRAFCIANGFDTNEIAFELHINDEKISAILEEISEGYKMDQSEPYRTLQIRTAVLALMNRMCKKYSSPESSTEIKERSASYIKATISYIQNSYEKDFSLEEVADFVGVSKCYLSREFHKYTGCTLVAYVNKERCKIAQKLLANKKLSVFDICRRCGFENPSYFAKSFKRHLGLSPNEYRKQF